MDVADTFGFLLGAWRVSRSIEDRLAGLTGSFEGSALLVIPPEWQARGVWARYDETGTLQFGGHSGPASRTLGYMRRFDGTVAVFFPDGRPYIDLDLRTGSCERDHPCREDTYRLTFTVHSLDEFEERWLGGIEENRLSDELRGDIRVLEAQRKKARDLPACQKLYDDRLATLPGVQRLTSTLVMKSVVENRPLPL